MIAKLAVLTIVLSLAYAVLCVCEPQAAEAVRVFYAGALVVIFAWGEGALRRSRRA